MRLEDQASPFKSGSIVSKAPRIASLDVMRGIVIVLMALDHARDYFSAFPYSPTDLSKASVALFLTRWVTHFCAPAFVFLAGTSARLQAGPEVAGRTRLQRFLLTRGLWLIVLELSWNSFMWRFSLAGVQLQVLWALGGSMIVLAMLLWLPRAAMIATGLVIVIGHHALDGIHARDFGPDASLPFMAWCLLHQPHVTLLADGFRIGILYPLLPWAGVMLLGYGLGDVMHWLPERRRRFLLMAGLGAWLLLIVLRAGNLYGEAPLNAEGLSTDWRPNPRGAIYTLLGFVNFSKYPPSLLYLLLTLGALLLLLPALERWQGRIASVFETFGRVPMFFYLLHVPLIHLMSLAAIHVMFGAHAAEAIKAPTDLPANYVPSLVPVYLGWMLVLALMFPLCRTYAAYKRRHRDNRWLSYL